jgi:hypothetical protein
MIVLNGGLISRANTWFEVIFPREHDMNLRYFIPKQITCFYNFFHGLHPHIDEQKKKQREIPFGLIYFRTEHRTIPTEGSTRKSTIQHQNILGIISVIFSTFI